MTHSGGSPSDELILDFPLGLPGFENSRKFILRSQPSFAPLACLQSTDSPNLCFLVVPVSALIADYTLWASSDDWKALRLSENSALENPANVLSLAILTVPGDGSLTANLLAPVVINLAAGVAVQAVRADRQYSHRHPVTALLPAAVAAEPKVPC